MIDCMPFNVKYATFVVQKHCNSRNNHGDRGKILNILEVIKKTLCSYVLNICFLNNVHIGRIVFVFKPSI